MCVYRYIITVCTLFNWDSNNRAAYCARAVMMQRHILWRWHNDANDYNILIDILHINTNVWIPLGLTMLRYG